MNAKKLASLFDNPNFAKWFGKSKAVDADGAPMTFYHGTSKKFDAFDPETQTANRTLGKGFYFSPREEGADFFKRFRKSQNPEADGEVIAAHLRLENPYIFEDYADVPLNGIDQSTLRNMGHDGVIVKRGGDLSKGEVTVFDPEQIKSVNNRGTFDPNDPNIYRAALPFAAGAGLMSMLPSDAEAVQRIREKDLPLEDAWSPLEAFATGVPGGLKAAAMGVLPDGAMDWAFNRIGGLMSGGGK